MKTFAAKLKAWRGARTQAAAAAALGVPPRTYEEWEQGRHAPRGLALATVLAKIIDGEEIAEIIMRNLSAKQPANASQSKQETKHSSAERSRPARRTGKKSKHEKTKR